MRILGIDPGTARLGYSILETARPESKQYELVECGIIQTDKNKANAERLHEIRVDLKNLINNFQPEILAIEQLFFFKNLKTVIPVAEARGVVLELAYEHNLKIFEYTPLQVKQILTGHGRAEKSAVEHAVMLDLKLTEKIRPDDAVDAVAIAICFLRQSLLEFDR